LVLLLNFAYAIKVAPEALSSHNFLLKLPHFASYTANWFGGVGIVGPQLFAYAWSLCAEEQFYAFWAPLLRYSKRVSIAAAVMAIIVTLDLWLESSPSGNVASAVATCRTILTSFATPIGFGALLAWLSHHSAFGPKLIAAASPRWVAPLVLLVTASLVITPWAPLVVLHAMLAILVFVCAAQQRHGLSRFLDHPVMTFVGRVSYGIYLWHVAVIGGIKQLYPSLKNEPGWLFACAMPLSVLVAAVSYRFYERPFLRLSTRYRRRVSCDVGLASHGAQSAG
jgi:peptidoglycan/LPS O-acetylase OafA/YrhL